jgi:hypothetical protein
VDHIELCYNDESSSNDRVMLSFQVRPIIHIYKLITVRACRVGALLHDAWVLCCMPRGCSVACCAADHSHLPAHHRTMGLSHQRCCAAVRRAAQQIEGH